VIKEHNENQIAAYRPSSGYEASYVSRNECGLIVTHAPGHAKVLHQSCDKLAAVKDRSVNLVILGCSGYYYEGKLVTFLRGDLDFTGSIIAAGVHATEYENVTDVDCIYSVNPSIVENPHPVKELTYQEMRELSYAGFSVFHDEALQPAFEKGVPVRVKNTNNPDLPVTRIVAKRQLTGQSVVGIASDEGFCSLNVAKYLMNREIG